jgi:UDP-N-acetylmuramate dehydrogenase
MLEQLRTNLSLDVRAGEPLAAHTTFKVGGPAEYYYEAKTVEDVMKAVTVARQLGVPYYLLGGGSNVLISDDGVKGLVIMLACRGLRLEGESVIAEAGATPGLIAQKTVTAGLTGMEWAVGLPGTVGGAVRGNAGMWGSEMKDSIVSVVTLHDGEPQLLSNEDCRFAYRDSRFKHETGWVILEVTLRLRPTADQAASRALLTKYLLDKKAKQPLEYPSAGCMFKNWRPASPADLDQLPKLLDLNGEEKVPLTPQGTVPAGWIIDRLGLKGYKMGQAQMSEKHANFLVNLGGADASNIVALASAIKMKVRNATEGLVQLEEEVEYVGF